MNRNKAQLIGYIGHDLKTIIAINGSKRVEIKMATHYSKQTRDGEKTTVTVWHNIVAWDATAEFAEKSFVRGSKIFVEGPIDYQVFTTAEGETIYKTYIKALTLINLDR